jgi:hypothetical protein
MFDALDALKKGEMTVEQAKAAVGIGHAIIDSARVEVEYFKTRDDAGGTSFIEGGESKQKTLPAGVRGITTHKIK